MAATLKGRMTRKDGPTYGRLARMVEALGDTDAERAAALGVSERTVSDLKKGIWPYWFTRMALLGLHEFYVEDARDIYAAAMEHLHPTSATLDT